MPDIGQPYLEVVGTFCNWICVRETQYLNQRKWNNPICHLVDIGTQGGR
jgi:hypothetical protein